MKQTGHLMEPFSWSLEKLFEEAITTTTEHSHPKFALTYEITFSTGNDAKKEYHPITNHDNRSNTNNLNHNACS